MQESGERVVRRFHVENHLTCRFVRDFLARRHTFQLVMTAKKFKIQWARFIGVKLQSKTDTVEKAKFQVFVFYKCVIRDKKTYLIIIVNYYQHSGNYVHSNIYNKNIKDYHALTFSFASKSSGSELIAVIDTKSSLRFGKSSSTARMLSFSWSKNVINNSTISAIHFSVFPEE